MIARRSDSSSAPSVGGPPKPSSAQAGPGGARPAASEGPRDFGATLRAARERKGVSLRQIADATKISVAVLEGLERNDISRLPAGIFGRAFVRSFAAEVGLDGEALVEQFTAQFRAELQVDGSPDLAGSQGRRPRVALAVAALLAGALIAMGVIYAAKRRTPAAPVRGGAAASSASPAPPASAPPPAPAVKPPARAAGPLPSSTPDAAEPFPAGGESVVGLSASRPCRVSAAVDGRRALLRMLQPGDERAPGCGASWS